MPTTTALDAPAKAPPAPESAHADDAARTIGTYVCSPENGTIPPNGCGDVTVTFTAARLGPVALPLSVRVVGTRDAAFSIDITATAMGPRCAHT